MKIKNVATDSLTPYARNAREHTPEQVEQIAASIESFGFNDPIGVWTNPETGTVEVESLPEVEWREFGVRVDVPHVDTQGATEIDVSAIYSDSSDGSKLPPIERPACECEPDCAGL